MRIFVDVDGTLTTEQRARSIDKSDPRQDVIDKVKKLQAEGHEIVLWTGSTEYAKRAAEVLGIDADVCVGKPHLLVDNEAGTWARRLRKRMRTPEEFLEMEIEPPK